MGRKTGSGNTSKRKKGSKKSATSCSSGGGSVATLNSSVRARDALEAAIRRYGHSAAIADLDSFPSGSVERQSFLDAAFNMCRDNLVMFLQEIMMGGAETHGPGYETQPSALMGETIADRNCPLVRALAEYGIRLDQVPEAAISKLRDWLRTFGRPLASKKQMLSEHEIRVQYYKAQEAKTARSGKKTGAFLSTSRNVVKEHTSDRFHWSKLKPVSIRDLKLFDSNAGSYLEGKLLVDPFTPMVGCTTILEDANGDVMLIALYNFLPDGVMGAEADPIASAKIPKGCTVRIAEPFLKVFKDGGRGIRIDNPHEITVVSRGGGRDRDANDAALATAKADGNELFGKNMFHAASEAYIEGLRKSDMVPTLLSNRSQAFIMMKDWSSALVDAAASLTIRPGCKKTWDRYRKALKELEEDLDETDDINKAKSLLEVVLLRSADIDGKAKDGDDASNLKSDGNEFFKRGDYAKAAQKYSSALAVGGGTCRALLSNWSQCCLNMGALNDSLATSAASLRIAPDGKALYRVCRSFVLLGEPNLSLQVMEKWTGFLTKSTTMSKINELADAARGITLLIENGDMRDPIKTLALPRDLVPYWYSDIETFDAGRKGRGVRSKVDLVAGQIVLIEHPIAFSESDFDKESIDNRTSKMLISIGETKIYDSTQNLIAQAIIGRSQREGLLSSVVDNLYDGVNVRPLVPLEKLIPNISSTSVLLPSHHEYLNRDSIILSAKQVQGLIATNSHGKGQKEGGNAERSTALFPATSMFNHSSTPTCDYLSIGTDELTSVLVATRPVEAGEELTVCYHPDEDVARREWGIE